jgi:hypothetical protein
MLTLIQYIMFAGAILNQQQFRSSNYISFPISQGSVRMHLSKPPNATTSSQHPHTRTRNVRHPLDTSTTQSRHRSSNIALRASLYAVSYCVLENDRLSSRLGQRNQLLNDFSTTAIIRA